MDGSGSDPLRPVLHAPDFEIPGGGIEALEQLVPAPGMTGHALEMLASPGTHVRIAGKTLSHQDTARAEACDEFLRLSDGIPAAPERGPDI
jgi:hypothetical protein